MNQEIRRVGVVGAGAMGRGIAQVCAAAGCNVQLLDSVDGAAVRALDHVRKDLDQAVSRGKLPRSEADATLARIAAVREVRELADCDLVVEAIVEQLEAKQRLFQGIEAVVKTDCILATNTSSLSVTAIAAACSNPQRVAGWHFFNPVPRMKLVEVVRAPRSAPAVVQALASLSQRVGHRAVVTSDSPGFVVNHVGRAFVTEGLKLLAERTAGHEVLDAILRGAGFRMGPFELLDLTGLDVSVPVMESIHSQYYGDDRYRPVALARTRLMAGLLGRKSGRGFYDHESQEPAPGVPPKSTPSMPAVAGRWWCVEDGPGAVPAALLALLPTELRSLNAGEADVQIVSPLATDLSTATVTLRLDASKAVAVDPLFFGEAGVTLMGSPATAPEAIEAARGLLATSVPLHCIADSPGYVAPRVVACIVNLACEMAQQGLASPSDIDEAARLGLGYPTGPFEWGERIGAKRVLEVLQGLYTTFGDPRYRPTPWLQRRARLGLPLSAPDLRQSP